MILVTYQETAVSRRRGLSNGRYRCHRLMIRGSRRGTTLVLGGGSWTRGRPPPEPTARTCCSRTAWTGAEATALHIYADSDEPMIVLDVEVLMHIDGTDHRIEAGGLAMVPRIPHPFLVLSESARLLCLHTPGCCQALYWDASEPSTPTARPPRTVDFALMRASAKPKGGNRDYRATAVRPLMINSSSRQGPRETASSGPRNAASVPGAPVGSLQLIAWTQSVVPGRAARIGPVASHNEARAADSLGTTVSDRAGRTSPS